MAAGIGAALLLGASTERARAQDPAAAVLGKVLDADGQPLRGAELRLISTETGLERGVATDANGGFSVLALEPGEYEFVVRPFLAPAWVHGARLAVAPGEVAQTRVEMGPSGEGPALVARREGEPGKTEGSVVRQGEGRDGDWRVLAAEWESTAEVVSATRETTLAGGSSAQGEEADSAAARDERETGGFGPGLSSGALPVLGDGPSVDGLATGQAFGTGARGVSGSGSRLNAAYRGSALRSLRVTGQSFSAQSGGLGGVAGISARATGYGLHGSAFFQARESAWAATNPFAVISRFENGAATRYLARPGESLLLYGGGAGLQLRVPGRAGWRLGLYGSVEERRRVQTLFSSPQNEDFFALTATQQALLANRGVGQAAVRSALSYLSGLAGTANVTGTQTLSFARIDLSPGQRDRMSLAYQRQRLQGPMTGGGQFAEGVLNRAVSSIGWSMVHADAGTARWLHVFAPRVTNEVRTQLARDLENEAVGAPPAGVPGIGPGGLAPEVAIEPEGFVYGTPAALGRVAYPDERRMELADTFSWRFGRHLLALGGDWSRIDEQVLAATNLDGTFLYDSGTTGGRAGGLVDWITDYTYSVHAYPNGACPSINASVHYFCFRSFSQSFTGAKTEFVVHQMAGFAEDTIRAASNLRVTLGARWDYTLLPFPQTPNATLDRALSTAGVAAMGSTASFPEDRNNVGPRVSVAWSPGGEGRHGRWFTVTAGYGMFFGRLPGATIEAALTDTGMAASTTRIRITPTVETACPQVTNQGFGFPCAYLSAPTGVVAKTASSLLFARSFRLPAVQRTALAVERALGSGLEVRAEYAASWATQLPESVDLNIAPSTATVNYVLQGGDGRPGMWSGQTFSLPLYTARRTTAFGPVSLLQSNANATYQSGTAEVQMHAFHVWAARASYTFSRALDYGPQLGATPRQNGQFDPFTNGYDKGLSSLNGPHRFSGDVVYRSEWHGGPRLLQQAVSGWRVAAVGTAGSGAPYSYAVFGGTRLSGGHESINGSGGATFLPTVGRNTLRLPARGRADLRVVRLIGLPREARLEVHGEVFNLLNTVSLTRVETRAFLVGGAASSGGATPLIFQDAAAVVAEGVSTPAFGTPLSSTSGVSRERTVELGARLHF